MESVYNVSMRPQMGHSPLGWDGHPNASYPSISLEQHAHGVFSEPSGQGVSSFGQPESFHYAHTYGMMSQGQVQSNQPQSKSSSLPQPQHILPSQGVPKACLACGKMECSLVSHKHFSKHILTTPKDRQPPSMRTQQQRTAGQTLPSPPTSGRPDTVVSYPIVMDAERQQLLSLWSREWSRLDRGPERHLFPIKFIDRVLPAARTHAPLFQCLLALSATLWAQANSVVDEVAARQLSFAVQMLSQACPTEQAASTDESMLAAILILLVYLAQGNGFEVGKHISGLIHLSALRGGLHYLGMSGLVAEVLMYADYMQAIFFDREPIWKLPTPPLDVGLPPRHGRGFRVLTTNNEVDLQLLMAADSLCRVTDILQYASTTAEALPSDVRNAFGYLSTIAEFQLAQCNARYHPSSSRDECLCLAMILFNLVVLRNEGAITPTIRKVEYRFWTSLETAEASNGLLKKLPRLSLWMLMTGLTVSIRGECQWRGMAVEKMRAIRMQAAIKNWEQFRAEVLEEHVWYAVAQEEVFKHIWMEVEGLKTMPTGAKG